MNAQIRGPHFPFKGSAERRAAVRKMRAALLFKVVLRMQWRRRLRQPKHGFRRRRLVR